MSNDISRGAAGVFKYNFIHEDLFVRSYTPIPTVAETQLADAQKEIASLKSEIEQLKLTIEELIYKPEYF